MDSLLDVVLVGGHDVLDEVASGKLVPASKAAKELCTHC